jgi:hypothetical protein
MPNATHCQFLNVLLALHRTTRPNVKEDQVSPTLAWCAYRPNPTMRLPSPPQTSPSSPNLFDPIDKKSIRAHHPYLPKFTRFTYDSGTSTNSSLSPMEEITLPRLKLDALTIINSDVLLHPCGDPFGK